MELAGLERTYFFEVGRPVVRNQNQSQRIQSEIYPPVLLLMGMIGVLVVRNHLYRERELRSLPVDWVAIAAGLALILSSPFIAKPLVEGLYFALAGLFLLILKRSDARVRQLLSRNSSLHDYASLLIIFLASFILLQNINSYLLIISILILYALALSILSRRT